MTVVAKLSFSERLAQMRAASNPALQKAIKEANNENASDISFGDITLNATQALAPVKALAGESFVLTGAAGTGKTTTQAAVVAYLEKADKFETHDFKYIGKAPSIAIVAFTKVAVRNMQKALKKNPATTQYADHCMTIHALLEYEPEVQERTNAEGQIYETKIFVPKRTASNPLLITHLIVEEASMVGMPLWEKIYDALLPGVQIIFLGDINQVPPVFGRSIMSYALCRLPVIELTQVYRQALESPIIANAHRILKGEMIQHSGDGRFNIVSGNSQYQVGQERMAQGISQVIEKLVDLGDFDEEQDIILIPWNKRGNELGTIRMNERIATFLGVKRNAIVTPIKAGFNTLYLAVGDKVLVDKQAGWITGITENPKYLGGKPPTPGMYSRDGTPLLIDIKVDWDADGADEYSELPDYSDFSMDDVEEEATKRAASHIVSVSFCPPSERGTEEEASWGSTTLSSAGDFSEQAFSFGYCMTIHKAQGSEWRKVYLIVHKDFLVSLNREMMYTAITRAREECTVFGKPDIIEAAIKRQSIKGNSLEEKINYFNGGALTDLYEVNIIPEAI